MRVTIFYLCIIVSLVNILFSTHFIPIMFIGVLLISFINALDNKYYYLLSWIILVFLIVENTQGFRCLSLVTLAFVIYIFIKPSIQQIFSSFDMLKILYISIFYLGIIFLHTHSFAYGNNLIIIIAINFLLDILIGWLFL